MYEIRTDLALEAREKFEEDNVEIKGVVLEEKRAGKDMLISKVVSESENGAKSMGKPKGTYVTLEAPNMMEEDEEYHKERMGVNSCDSWIDEDTPYILLSEEVEQEYYVSEYWTDELKKKYEVVETIREIDDLIKIINGLVVELNKSPYELFESELVQVGTDKNALK